MKHRWSTLVLCAVVATVAGQEHARAGDAWSRALSAQDDVATDASEPASRSGGQARIIEHPGVGFSW